MWEYKKVATIEMSESDLNAYGKEGWEHYLVIGQMHYFKRLKQEKQRAVKDK